MKRRPDILVAVVVVAVVIAAAAWLGPLAPPAAAHAALLSSTPPAGSSVRVSPAQLVCTFAEPPDPAHSTIQVLGPAGKPLAGVSATKPFPGNPLQLYVDLPPRLPRGVYTVVWKTVSALDGHVDSGVMAFGVRVTPPPINRFAVPAHTPAWQTALSSFGRWLLYWGLALLLGAASTCLIAFRGLLPSGGRALLRGAWVVAAAGLAVMILTERAIIGAPALLPLFETAEGRAYLYLGAALAVCLVAVGLVDVWPGTATLYGLGAAVAVAMLVHVRAGHADAVAPRLVNLAVQWVHVMAVGVWVGGLAWLLLGLRYERTIDHGSAVARFSTAAGICLGLVVVTGTARALAEIGSPGDLLTTSYGTALLIKIGLVVVIALLGAMNRYRHVPALLASDERLGPFRWTVRSEVAVAAAVLAVTAVLVGLVPAVSAPRAAAGAGAATASAPAPAPRHVVLASTRVMAGAARPAQSAPGSTRRASAAGSTRPEATR